MPIVVKDYIWEEAEKTIYITVPLKGVRTNSVDIFSTETYIKVHYPPYLFESFLYAAVYDQKSAAQIGNGVVVFKLEKQEPVVWGQLQHKEAGDKNWQLSQRQQAIERSQTRTEEEHTAKAEAKRELDRFGVRSQMTLEDSNRQRIETEKESERQKATTELEQWKQQQQELAEQQKIKAQEMRAKEEEETKIVAKAKKKVKSSEIFREEAGSNPLRDTGVIEVSFTARTFPTPSRESTKPDEDAWLKKQAESRRIIELENEDLSVEERNPVWLRDKGNDFFKAGNYQAAINVFSHAIRLDSQLPSLFSNRAACNIKLRNFFKAIEDSSKALELLTPPVPQNASSRCKAHVRRGTAFCQLELYVEGLQDYEAALKLDSNNEQLKKDADQIRNIIQTAST